MFCSMKVPLILSLVLGIYVGDVYGAIELTELTESSGAFNSPNYPLNYPVSYDNDWIIRLPNKKHNVFVRILHFETEEDFDFLEFYDGNNPDTSTLLRRLDGIIPKDHGSLDVVSSGPEMYIRFISDVIEPRVGFTAEYYSLTGDFELTDSSGSFSTPNYPYFYNNSEFIRWVIKADDNANANSVTTLTFQSFGTEACCDKVQIRTNSGIYGTFSGNTSLQPIIFPNVSDVTIYFTSDLTGRDSGFLATYSSARLNELVVYPVRNLSNTFGEIASNNFPYNYTNHIVEEWLIEVTTPYKNKVSLLVKELDTEYDRDVLEIYDGSSIEAPLLDRLSGNANERHFLSNGTSMFLRFTTNSEISRRGFVARYESVLES